MMGISRRRIIALSVSLGGLSITGKGARAGGNACEHELPEGAGERVTYTPIAEGLPLDAPDQALRLYRFTMPPGEALPAHSHPGVTMLQVEAGELAYTIASGQVHVWTSGPDGKRTERRVPAGETAVFGPGDAIFYDADTAHSAVNQGPVPVAVLAVTLLDARGPQTIPAADG